MAETIKASVSIPKMLFDEADMLAQRLNISQSRLFEIALETFVRNSQSQIQSDETQQADEAQSNPDAKTEMHTSGERLVIHQGGVYWLQINDLSGSEPGIPHPHVVIQDNLFNHSRIHTVIVCALTSNLKRAGIPGNVLLDAGEANLPRQSVVETSKMSTVEKIQLREYIGSLSEQRIHQILDGMRFLQRSFFDREA